MQNVLAEIKAGAVRIIFQMFLELFWDSSNVSTQVMKSECQHMQYFKDFGIWVVFGS